MTQSARFGAPWSAPLKIITALSATVLVLVASTGWQQRADYGVVWTALAVVLPLTILVVAALFAVLGYELHGRSLYIHRPGWRSRIELEGLLSADVDPDAMRRSIRTFGNGGLFSFTGRFRNKRLGSFRAFATDPELAVVLRFADATVIVTPDRPEAFALQVQRQTMA